MDRRTQDIIRQCAQEVRNWAEDQADDPGLGGWCARCSAELWYLLDDVGIKAEIRMYAGMDGSAHVFLGIDDHILCVTATQFQPFKDTPILFMHERETAYRFFEYTDVFMHPKDLIKDQKATKWPSHQMAFKARQLAPMTV
jgi:hypothetical protein